MLYDSINLASIQDMVELETITTSNPDLIDQVVAEGLSLRGGCVAVLMLDKEAHNGVYLPPSGRLGSDCGIVLESTVAGVAPGDWVGTWFESGFNQYEKDGHVVRVYGVVEPWNECILLTLDRITFSHNLPVDGWRLVERVEMEGSGVISLEPLYESRCKDLETGDQYVHATDEDTDIVKFNYAEEWGLGPNSAMIREDDILAEYDD